MKTDILIVGCGVAGLYCALNLPDEKKITIITKSEADRSDSFLAQGGICVLRDNDDFDSFYDDTMKAGHFENNPEAVKIMIDCSRSVINDLISYGTKFATEDGELVYTREGAHSKPRILYHRDETGKEITLHLLRAVRAKSNITLIEKFTMVDLIAHKNCCYGIVGVDEKGVYTAINADYTVLATGGIGGLFKHSTNYRHLTGDSLALALKHKIKLKNIDYIQIHPTTLYSEKSGREFLISESVRGEGAVLLNSKGERFVNELLPRDVVAKAIYEEMKKEGTEHVWLSMTSIGEDEIKSHFRHIYNHCLKEGYDVTKESIPVVPSQHYFMGGIDVDMHSKTSMSRLYAAGETACNGVHGKNRLASNSLLESMVFAKRAADNISTCYKSADIDYEPTINPDDYNDYADKYKTAVLDAIEKEKCKNE